MYFFYFDIENKIDEKVKQMIYNTKNKELFVRLGFTQNYEEIQESYKKHRESLKKVIKNG